MSSLEQLAMRFSVPMTEGQVVEAACQEIDDLQKRVAELEEMVHELNTGEMVYLLQDNASLTEQRDGLVAHVAELENQLVSKVLDIPTEENAVRWAEEAQRLEDRVVELELERDALSVLQRQRDSLDQSCDVIAEDRDAYVEYYNAAKKERDVIQARCDGLIEAITSIRITVGTGNMDSAQNAEFLTSTEAIIRVQDVAERALAALDVKG